VDGGVEQPFPPTLSGFAITRILFDVGDQPRIEDHLPIALGIKAAIEVEIGASEIHPDLFGHAFQRFQTIREQHRIRFIDWSDWTWR
jgi:hypothetical protein